MHYHNCKIKIGILEPSLSESLHNAAIQACEFSPSTMKITRHIQAFSGHPMGNGSEYAQNGWERQGKHGMGWQQEGVGQLDNS